MGLLVFLLSSCNQVLFQLNKFFFCPFFQSRFTKVISKSDWLRLFDRLFPFKEDADLLLLYADAFLKAHRTVLIQHVYEVD